MKRSTKRHISNTSETFPHTFISVVRIKQVCYTS